MRSTGVDVVRHADPWMSARSWGGKEHLKLLDAESTKFVTVLSERLLRALQVLPPLSSVSCHTTTRRPDLTREVKQAQDVAPDHLTTRGPYVVV